MDPFEAPRGPPRVRGPQVENLCLRGRRSTHLGR